MRRMNATQWTAAAVTGAVFAISAAVLLRIFPEDFYLDNGKRMLMFVLAALLAPPTVLLVRRVARLLHADPTAFLYAANTGAVLFDSIATGFAPQFYGHRGPAAHVVLAVIVFGLAAIFLTDQFFPSTEKETK
ncbi:MAG: hypothetical protein RJA47_992 [Actinomycetota bacterium]